MSQESYDSGSYLTPERFEEKGVLPDEVLEPLEKLTGGTEISSMSTIDDLARRCATRPDASYKHTSDSFAELERLSNVAISALQREKSKMLPDNDPGLSANDSMIKFKINHALEDLERVLEGIHGVQIGIELCDRINKKK